MAGKGSREAADPSRSRAILLLSLIVLLYNLAAFGRQDFFCPPPGSETAAASGAPQDAPARPGGFRGAGKGPLSIRQKFLAGRRVDVNRAAWREISELPGISDKVARSVEAERERVGRFRRPSDLLGVAGIKEKRLQIILPFLAGFDNN